MIISVLEKIHGFEGMSLAFGTTVRKTLQPFSPEMKTALTKNMN